MIFVLYITSPVRINPGCLRAEHTCEYYEYTPTPHHTITQDDSDGTGGGGWDRTRRLKELLGHVGPATLVDDVGDREDHLERDQQEDEEAHAWAGGRNDYYVREKQLAD